jgi:hypothetical protein
MLVSNAALCSAQVTPLRNTAAAPRSAEIELGSVEFRDLQWGREGPNYCPTRRAPQRGAPEIAEASVYGHAAIAAIRFEAIDTAGQALGTAAAARTASGVDDGGYVLRIETPAQPFRVRITGQDVRGRPFTRLYAKLFRPGDEPAPAPQLPAGLTIQQADQFRHALDVFRRQLEGGFQPETRIPRSEVAGAGYEALRSSEGKPLGLRLLASVRFSVGGNYAVSPHVFPLYANSDWRSAITMKVLDAQVDPAPEVPAGIPLADVIRYGGEARYQGEVEYRFVFDLVPSYVIRNAGGTRYCLFLEPFRSFGRLPVWNAILADSAPVKYSVNFTSLGFAAETGPLAPQRVWYESFLREGAADCGPAPNANF